MSNTNSTPLRGQMIEMHCPNCNKLVGTYGVGEYRYGSPLKVCPKCKTEYINPVFHEIEIDGIAPEAFDIKRLLIALVFGIVFFAIGAGIHYFEVTTKDYYHYSYIFIMLISVMVIFFAIGNIIIKTGLKAKRNERLRQESADRLSNPRYAVWLHQHGYNVPEKYLPEEYLRQYKTEASENN